MHDPPISKTNVEHIKKQNSLLWVQLSDYQDGLIEFEKCHEVLLSVICSQGEWETVVGDFIRMSFISRGLEKVLFTRQITAIKQTDICHAEQTSRTTVGT